MEGVTETAGRTVRAREAGREASAGMNTESDPRLSYRMSHLVRHCAVNETERGGTPAERGCRVCDRGPESIIHSLREGKRKKRKRKSSHDACLAFCQ